MTKLTMLNPVEVATSWNSAKEKISEALIGEDIPEQLNNIYNLIINGINQLWKIENEEAEPSWAVTFSYRSRQDALVLQIHLACAEDSKYFLDVLGEFEMWAKKSGAEYIEAHGRMGWKKVLTPYGFKHNYTSFIKPVYKELH